MGKSSPGLIRRWLIWFLPAFFQLYQYGMQISPSLKVHYLETHFLLTNVEIGMLTTFYLIPYVLLQIPVGFLYDFFNAKKLLTSSLIIFSVGTLLVYISNIQFSYPLYSAGRFLMGLAASTAFIGALYLAAHWLDKKHYKLAVSFTIMMELLGVFIIGIALPILIVYFGWSELLLVNTFFCLFIAAVMWIVIKDPYVPSSHHAKDVVIHLKQIMSNKELWLCAILTGCAFANIMVLTNMWRVDYLEHIYKLSAYQATIDNGYSIIGYVIAAPIIGFWSQRLKNLRTFILICTAIEFILLISCNYLISNITIKTVLYFGIGFFSANVLLVFTLTREVVKEKQIGVAIGFVNMFSVIIGMLLVPVVGELLDLTNKNYLISIIPVMIATFIAVICAAVLLIYSYKQKPRTRRGF